MGRKGLGIGVDPAKLTYHQSTPTHTQAPGDDTGKLVLQLSKDGQQEIALALEPGESVLLQGAHVRHQANQSQRGCRVSLVVSLTPASVLLPDTTRVWVGRLCE